MYSYVYVCCFFLVWGCTGKRQPVGRFGRVQVPSRWEAICVGQKLIGSELALQARPTFDGQPSALLTVASLGARVYVVICHSVFWRQVRWYLAAEDTTEYLPSL